MADGEPVAALDRLPLSDQSSYLSPARECDLVMKGGITSGVVYPLAVCRLATRYRLRQVGGTSAGAIAAATAAAAEHGREAGGFVKLAALPKWLAEPAPPPATGSNLRTLFQPAPLTRKTFSIAMALIEQGTRAEKTARLVARTAAAHPLAAVAAAVPGLLFVLGGLALGGGAAAIAVLAGLVLAVVGAAAGLAVAAVLHAGRVLPQNGFGLCPGSPGLTDWLAERLDDVAGLHGRRAATGLRGPNAATGLRGPNAATGLGGRRWPLTFGDLEAKGIQLRMLTTSLTHGLPHRLPFEDRRFLYDSAQLRRLFPPYVVDHMDAHAEPPSSPVQGPPGVTLRHLPEMADLPVVVAVRMSLSFPLLCSAVPLWGVDYGGTGRAEPVWFSDGGITSNFPVHFFDALLPARPTFAINLGPGQNLHPTDPRRNIVVPTRATSGILPRWTRIEGVIGFGRAILDTMQNWSDNNQSRMPGYRDRIIRVLHTEDEGGLNLDMDPATIGKLTARGEAAAEEFLRFDLAKHRWIRYRSSMAVLEKTVARFHKGYTAPVAAVPTYSEMIDDPPDTYDDDWTGPKAEFARERTEDLVAVAEGWPHPTHSFAEGAPNPAPILRVTPDV